MGEDLVTFRIGADPPPRLDKALARDVPESAHLSRSRIARLIAEGAVRVGGEVARDATARVAEGAAVAIVLGAVGASHLAGEAIALAVVFEDADLIVIDKPAGLVVHPAAGHEDGTLVNALIAHCGESLSGIGGVRRPGIVHRLDKDTSGLIVVAKNDHAHQELSAQFADHGRTGPLERAYLAIVWGMPRRPHGTIDAPIDRSSRNREKMAVVPEGRGRHAVTHYEVLDTYPTGSTEPVASLVRCVLETGRTHQIRVHMAHIGHPLLGDRVYGSGFVTKAARLPEAPRQALAAMDRQALHATLLGFTHPGSGETLGFTADPPEDFARLQDSLAKL
jgi:23S rRNA pseudouridine1911/1915/1917 synthase